MPASNTPHTEGRDTLRERGLPGQVGAVISKDRQELAATSRIFCLWYAPESIQGVSTGSCSLSGASQEWPVLPPGWFTPLSCSLCTLPWLLPLSQRECQLGTALIRSVEEGTGAPAVPKAGAVEHCWSWVGCPTLEGTGKGQVPWGATQIWKPCLKHCHSMSPALAAMGTDMHLSFCTGIAQPPFLAFLAPGQLFWLSMGINPGQYFYLF